MSLSFVAFNMIVSDEQTRVAEDDLEQETVTTTPAVTTPVTVNTQHIREFYARKGGKPGTRITFSNSAAIVVQEPYDAVQVAVARKYTPS
jgi:competence transcription factor ComK